MLVRLAELVPEALGDNLIARFQPAQHHRLCAVGRAGLDRHARRRAVAQHHGRMGAAAYESAEFGISTAPSCCSVTIVTVAVMLGSRVTSVWSTEIRALYVTTLEVVVPEG